MAVAPVISLNSWRTQEELIKLASYLMAGWLAYRMSRSAETANLLYQSALVIGTLYAVYALVIGISSWQHPRLFYDFVVYNEHISGPFLNHNSFATYCGMISVMAFAKLYDEVTAAAPPRGTTGRKIRFYLELCFGKLWFSAACFVLLASAVIASGSRAGAAATAIGIICVACLFVALAIRRQRFRMAEIVTLCAAILLLLVIGLHGEILKDRFNALLTDGGTDSIRTELWGASWRMVDNSPLLGLGLGTFEDAYPMYATHVLPFVMDKAHCDYLEFAAGIGLPAAIAFWLGLIGVVFICARGPFERRRNRYFSTAAVGVGGLVAVHSCVDFSLQLPSVAFLFSVVLGVGTAQATSSRRLD